MNYDEQSGIDLSSMTLGTFKAYALIDDHNKENANKNMANISISSLGAGILSETQLNMSGNCMLSSASFFNPNESFDGERVKLDVYEKSVTKLANENKALRKRVKNLMELARTKEQEIIESLNKACEEKQKSEQKNQEEHECQLQTYYECFLSIEKENNQLKLKIEQMRGKLIEQQDKLDELNREKSINEIKESTALEIKPDESDINKTKEDLNLISMQHINNELSNATKTAEMFVEEKMSLTSQQSTENEYPDHFPCINNKKENEQLKQKIDELILEKTTLEKRLDSIEKALQRWIFRACDDKCNLKKAEEKCEKLEADIKVLMNENETVLLEKESNGKLLQMNRIQLEDTQLILKQTELLLNDKDNHIDKLSNLNQRLEIENQEISYRLEFYINKSFMTAETQTDQIHQINTKTSSSCSKLNELSVLNGHVAKTAAKFNTNNPQQQHQQPQQPVEVSNELKTVKLKNDNLIIEKSQLKFKNDELKFENDELKSKIDDLIKQMESVKQINPQTAAIKTTITQSVQTLKSQNTNQETQTNQVQHIVNNSGSDLLWRTRFDSIKQEFDHAKSESYNEMNKLKANLNSQIEMLQKTCAKLEIEIKEDKLKIAKLSDLNKEISADLTTKQTECSHYEQSIAKMNCDHKKEKQISDTIIYQQKKLLNFLQNKLNPEEQEQGNHHQNLNLANHHLGSIKLFKRNKQNPLLANLNKPSIPYQFANNVVTPQTNTMSSTSSKSSCDKKTVKEIEAELNSNYVAYSELARERKPPSIPAPLPKPLQQQANEQKSVQLKNQRDKKIHVFTTGLNTCPIYCDVCQHLIPLIAYASKCQLCSFTCHSTCSNLRKSMSSKSKTALALASNTSVCDPLKYCHINYLKISQLYNNYITKLSSFISVSQLEKANSSLLSDYLHIFMDNKWRKYWTVLRIDGQLEIYQTKTNLKPFETINLVTDRIMFETDYNLVKKLITTSVSAIPPITQKHQEEEVNLYEQVDPSQKQALMQESFIDFAQSSLIILVYNQRISHQIGFESFSTKSVWLDALQSASLISHKNTKQLIPNSADQFKSYSLNKVLNPFLELSDTAVNSYCVISQKLIALACDDGLYINQIETESHSSSANISLIKIDSIESAHKLSYQPEFGKLCLIGRRSRQFLSIDTNELLSKPLIEQQQQQQQDEIDYEQDEDYPKINVRIEHIQNIDRCHLFESYLSQNGYWYLAVATPETIFILLFNKTTSKYTLVKTINSQADSPCLCLKFSHFTNQLIYGCSKEFFKLDMTYLQPTPIMDSVNKKNADDELSQLIKLQKQPIGICVINLTPLTDNSAVLLCYEDYALILTFNKTSSNWQLQQQQIVIPQPVQILSKKTTSSSSLSSNLSNNSCLKWPRGSPPLQIEFNANNLYLFYNDSVIVYKVSFDLSESLFLFKKSGVAFVYKPRHLSSYQKGNENYLIISNRRPVICTSVLALSDIHENRPYFDYEANENDYNDEDMLNEDEIKSRMKNKNDENDENDENDRICLSYFCLGEN